MAVLTIWKMLGLERVLASFFLVLAGPLGGEADFSLALACQRERKEELPPPPLLRLSLEDQGSVLRKNNEIILKLRVDQETERVGVADGVS